MGRLWNYFVLGFSDMDPYYNDPRWRICTTCSFPLKVYGGNCQNPFCLEYVSRSESILPANGVNGFQQMKAQAMSTIQEWSNGEDHVQDESDGKTLSKDLVVTEAETKVEI